MSGPNVRIDEIVERSHRSTSVRRRRRVPRRVLGRGEGPLTNRERIAWARSTSVAGVNSDARFLGVTVLRAITENA